MIDNAKSRAKHNDFWKNKRYSVNKTKGKQTCFQEKQLLFSIENITCVVENFISIFI